MERKWWYTRGLQAPLFFVVLCFAQQVLAEPVSRGSAQKEKADTVSTRPPASVKAAAAKKGKSRTVTKASHKSSTRGTAKRHKRTVMAKARAKSPGRRGGTRKAIASSKKRIPPTVSLNRSETLFPMDEGPESAFLYSPERAPFVAQVNGEQLPYRINSVFAFPAEQGTLKISDPRTNSVYLLQSALDVTQTGPNTWSWHTPRKAGVYPIQILHPNWGATIMVNVFVLVPASRLQRGYLNGYRIGHYPNFALKQLPMYTPPRGFIEVTRENENVLVSPHFRLRQFLCKQKGGYPKYLALDQRLLSALEFILEKVNKSGYHSRTFAIMSGYRTPHYNRAIGNSTTHSRHLWGDAADIFIDESPRDGEMDDLNRDGVVNFRDAAVLHDIVDDLFQPRFYRLSATSFTPDLTGGLAPYRGTAAHGPFVHIDVRGIYTRWGR